MHTSESDPLPSRLKHLIAAQFRLALPAPDLMTDDEPLIGGRLGLDSLDALELAISLEEEFGLTIHSREDSERAFANIKSLAGYIHAHRESSPHGQHQPMIAATGVSAAIAPSTG